MSDKIQLEPLTEDEKPTLQIDEVEGNVFAIIGAVSKALKQEGHYGHAEEFRTVAFQCDSYDQILNLTHRYVEWE